MPAVSPEACRFARQTLLGWSMADLAAHSKVSKDAIRRFEGGEAVMPRTVDSLRTAMERAGVEFVVTGSRAPGMELHLPDGMIVRRRRDAGSEPGAR